MNSYDTRALIDEFQNTWTVMKSALEDAKSEVKRYGAESGDLRTKISRIDSRLDWLETKLHRPAMDRLSESDPDSPLGREAREKKALFIKLLRSGGMDALSDSERRRAHEYKYVVGPAEAKALSLGNDAAGGFLAPPEFAMDIIKAAQLISPMRTLAAVRQTSRRSVQVPVRSGVFAAAWIGETATRAETTGLTYSMEEIPTHEAYAEVIVSEQELEDSVFNLEAEIRNEAAEQLAKAEGYAFVRGDSLKKPEGVMTNSAIATDLSGTDGKVAHPYLAGTSASGDALIEMAYNLKSEYASGATWILNRKTVGAVRKLTDGQGHYLWEPSFQAGGTPTLVGMPYVEMPDMDDEGSNTFPIALGNFRRGYLIVDRVDIVVKRLNEKYAEQGQVAFIVRKRVGGQVVLPESIRKYKCASS